MPILPLIGKKRREKRQSLWLWQVSEICNMEKLRTYGKSPFKVVVVHGGPGAPGEMASVARRLSAGGIGVLEPLQSANSVKGQIEELYEVLGRQASRPVTLIGYSWGAWLSFIFSAKYPTLVGKLILIGSGPFEEKYCETLKKRRLGRLDSDEREEAEKLLCNTHDLDSITFSRLGSLMSKADSFDPIAHESEVLKCDSLIFHDVWPEAAQMRKEGKLIKMAAKITCPTIAIHGKYDPHPPEGVKEPLEARINEFRFIELDKCGHTPWIERQASERFYTILEEEI